MKWKAENGDETALQILRSKKEPTQNQPSLEFVGPASKVSSLKIKQSQFKSDSSLAWKDKRKLLSISKMLQLQAEEAKCVTDPNQRNLNQMTWRVDSSGNVLDTLKNGAIVKDNGNKIFFSVNEPGATQVAQNFARLMLGRNVKVSGNEISNSRGRICNDRISHV
ncbi:relaxase [Desulfovibrio sp. JC022]|uniref:relaxase n=1 Tax=Desulfovibrio sp. JC022 TaxID=2593642 RepID=UPI001EF3D2FB|nr:relaxase [Desulfovibrio sp. JC022]